MSTQGTAPERFRMETNFEGLIKLLAEHLYSEPDVFVRELVQNANDSIVRRRRAEPDYSGRIEITVDRPGRRLVFRDNGVGMDRADIRQFLSVIGSSGTGATRKELAGGGPAFELIGQFGIGMLSAFVVAETVTVRTRKLGSAEAFSWRNSGSIDCELSADDKPDVGTEIVVSVSPDYSFMLDAERLRAAVVKYCEFIQFPVMLDGSGPVNAVEAPWHRREWPSDEAREAAYRDFLNRRYPDLVLDVIPVEIDGEYEARGALFVSDSHLPGINTAGVVDIYVRRMLIRASDDTLLPPWAKFVRGVVDTPDLQPTAARDQIQRTHPSFEYLQRRLGEIVVERLGHLAEADPQKFARINLWHHYHLKGMAFYHDEFFERVGDLLLFETSRGLMSLRQYLAENAGHAGEDGRVPVYYFAYRGAAAQFYRLAEARGWAVVNAGYSFEEDLLRKYASLNPGRVRLERIDATDDPELFGRLSAREEEAFRQLELDVEGHLFRAGARDVRVQVRRFSPAELPAVIIETPETEAERRLNDRLTALSLTDAFDDIAREALEQGRRRPQTVSLNADNPLVLRLLAEDRRNPLVREVMLGVYHSALLYSHNMLTQNSAEAIHAHLVRLYSMALADPDALLQNRADDDELDLIG
ncbi:MAG TPA: ATP-binding protein [Pyrinomonadaceae bacterium]|nr:ATP-binding protein [Pyrinomonadaceae bacterium]